MILARLEAGSSKASARTSYPPVSDLSRVRKAYTISDGESFAVARTLLKSEGLLTRLVLGDSAGGGTALLPRAEGNRSASSLSSAIPVIKYLSKMFDDRWMTEQGLLSAPGWHGDLRDLISGSTTRGAVVTVGPGDTLQTAYSRMRASTMFRRCRWSMGIPCVGLLDVPTSLSR